jgi:2,3-diketo-5-methylthio-1-phosphopentane phosphatase
MPDPRAVLFIDFDGTITVRDATDALLEAFADPDWLRIEAAWVAGRIGSRECLAEQMALVRATPEQLDAVLDAMAVDVGFAPLLDVCARHRVPVHVLSDGFDYCIDRILGRRDLDLAARLRKSTIVSSCLRADGSRWRASFPHPVGGCTHGCATCKPAAMAALARSDAFTVFVGDGLSDRYAAACASVVFAKGRLAAYCDDASIPYAPYTTLDEVARSVGHLLVPGAPLPLSLSTKAFPTV